MTIHSRPVIASLYSQSSLSPRSGTAFSSVSLSPGATFAVASGKDVLHVLRLNLDRYAADSNRLEEIRSIRISQVSLFLHPLFILHYMYFYLYLLHCGLQCYAFKPSIAIIAFPIANTNSKRWWRGSKSISTLAGCAAASGIICTSSNSFCRWGGDQHQCYGCGMELASVIYSR